MRMFVLLVIGLLAAGGDSRGGDVNGADATATVVSSWRGGALTLERFIAVYDPDMRVIAAGGTPLREAVCKATYREIYVPQARQKGLDKDPLYLAELEKWRRDRLSALYVERNSPDFSSTLTEEKLREFYEKTKSQIYTSSGSVDLEVLFLRCSEDEAERRDCEGRMADYRARLSDGARFETVIEEEKGRSGAANGVFRRLAMKSLTPDLAKIASELPLGEYSSVIKTPIGLYLLRVSARTPPGPMAYSQVDRHVRQEAARAALAEWCEIEASRLRDELDEGCAGGGTADEVFAAAARAQGLDDDPDFVSAEWDWSSWELANRGLFADRAVMPPDEEIRRQLEDDPIVSRRFRRYSAVLAVVGAQDGRYRMIEAVTRVSKALREADDSAAALAVMAGREPLVDVFPIGDADKADFKRLDRGLSECVAGLGPGGWCGPTPIPSPRDLPEDLRDRFGFGALPAGSAFVALEGWRVPRIDEVRDAYNGYFRSTIASCDPFLEAAGPRWDLKIQPPSSVSPLMTGGP